MTAPACFNRRTTSASFRWYSVAILVAGCRGPHARGVEEVFQSDGNAVERSAIISRAYFGFGLRACSSARSAVTAINALRRGLSRSMRARHSRVSSSGDRRRVRICSAASVRVSTERHLTTTLASASSGTSRRCHKSGRYGAWADTYSCGPQPARCVRYQPRRTQPNCPHSVHTM